jgi:hypothetical protein
MKQKESLLRRLLRRAACILRRLHFILRRLLSTSPFAFCAACTHLRRMTLLLGCGDLRLADGAALVLGEPRRQALLVVALQVAFERQTLKPVFSLYRL